MTSQNCSSTLLSYNYWWILFGLSWVLSFYTLWCNWIQYTEEWSRSLCHSLNSMIIISQPAISKLFAIKQRKSIRWRIPDWRVNLHLKLLFWSKWMVYFYHPCVTGPWQLYDIIGQWVGRTSFHSGEYWSHGKGQALTILILLWGEGTPLETMLTADILTPCSQFSCCLLCESGCDSC